MWQNAAPGIFVPGAAKGRQLLDQIFGSDEISRRVAQQAAEMTGVKPETMQQLLPVLAGIYAGGMSHWMTGAGARPSKLLRILRGRREATKPDCQSLGGMWARHG